MNKAIGILSAVIFFCGALDGSAAELDKPPKETIGAASAVAPALESEAVQIKLEKSALAGTLALTLNGAVELALERNPNLVVEKIRVEQARGKIEEEKGNYDPVFNLRGSLSRKDNVVASRFYPTGLYVDSERTQGLGLQSRFYTGARFGIDLDFKRLASTSNTQTLSPQYAAIFAFTFLQPLLRDFGWGVNTTRLRVAQLGEPIAERTLAQKTGQLVQQVEEGYWSLLYLRQDLEVRKNSVFIAQELLRRSEDLFRAGRIAAVSVLEARSGMAAREEALIVAEREYNKFEDRLKLLLNLDPGKTNVSLLDRPNKEPVALNSAKSVELALKQRPEIQALQLELEQRELEQKFATNQTLPRLDFTVQYGMNGISGRPNKTCQNPLGPGECVEAGAQVNGSIFAGETRPKDAFDKFFTHSPFDNWSVELKLQIPLWNRTANAQLSEANLKLNESKVRLRAARDQIETEVRDAVREVISAKRRMDAALETIKFVEDQLDGSRKKFEAGLGSSYEVLQVVDDLEKARSNENRAVLDYNVGQSKLRLAESTVLAHFNIELKKTPRYQFVDN
jgi:outer membrane protein TolC